MKKARKDYTKQSNHSCKKNQALHKRIYFSLLGLKWAWLSEVSFRSQVVMTFLAFIIIAYLGADPLWWGLFISIIGVTLAAELFNTALEALADLLHPDFHPQIGRVKDTAAAAVLLLSVASVLIFIAFLFSKWKF